VDVVIRGLPVAVVLTNDAVTACWSAGVAGVPLGAVDELVVMVGGALVVVEPPDADAEPPPCMQAAVTRPVAAITAPAASPVTRRMLPPRVDNGRFASAEGVPDDSASPSLE